MFDTALISAIASVLMLGVWIIYLHIVYVQYRQSNNPFLVIHHAHGNDPSAVCMFVNMSKEPIYVQSVLARVRYSNEEIKTHNITDYNRITPDDKNIQERLKQGPLQPGAYLLLGTFEDIITGRQSEDSENKLYNEMYKVENLELCIAAIHGPTKSQIGARRYFKIIHNKNSFSIKAHSIYTEQLISKKKRDTVRKWVEKSLEPVERGEDQDSDSSQSGRKIEREKH